jgi:hypothetical protein
MFPAEGDAPQVSTTVIFDQVRVMRELYGAELVARAEAAMPQRLRDELTAITPGGWMSLDAPRELKNNIAALIGTDPMELQRVIVGRSIERTLTTIWRFLLRQLSDAAISKRTPLIYARSFNRGSLAMKSWSEGRVELELSGWSRIPEYDLVGLMTGVQKVLELAGRKEVKVTATRRSPLVLIHGTWRR